MPPEDISHVNGDPEGESTPSESTPEPTPPRGLSRRTLLIGGGTVGVAALVGGVLIGRALPHNTQSMADGDSAATTTPKLRKFVSTDVTVPKMTSTKWGDTAPGYLLVDPNGDQYQGLIMDDSAEPVWIEPPNAKISLTDLRVQEFEGKPVLTYWSGTHVSGHGMGAGTIKDTHYRTVATVHTGPGMDADMHEFNLTSHGTALMTAYPVAKADMSFFGGPSEGYIYNCHIQEVDVRTGKVLLDWSAMDHIEMKESYRKLGDKKGRDGSTVAKAFDPFHLNAADDDGDTLLISSRYTHTVYSVDRSSGAVRWRFGGKHSDFPIAKAAQFAWQHDVRRHPDGTLSLFDNHRWEGSSGSSRGLIFELDEDARTATLKQAYRYDGHLGHAMGSVQPLPNTNVLVGWGSDPALTEFTAAGKPIFQVTGIGTSSYRANRSPWVAQPDTVPDVGVVVSGAKTLQVYASWNGATEVAAWRVLSDGSTGGLRPVKTVTRTGFETSVSIPAAGQVAVQALDTANSVLATSATHLL